MLIAVTVERRRVVATAGTEALCPQCGQDLIVRVPRERVPHFAHHPHAGCTGKRATVRRRAHERDRDETDEDQLTLFDL